MYGVSEGSGNGEGYIAMPNIEDQDLEVVKWTGNSRTYLVEKSTSLNTGLYDIEVEWKTNDEHVVTFYEMDSSLNRTSTIDTFTVTDSDYGNNTGIGFWSENGRDRINVWDDYRIV